MHAIDIDRGSVANTLANAFRNGVSDRVNGDTIDLFQWEPTDRFDVIAASLYQMPVDPYEEPSGHRPLDFWGRNLFDRFLALLPDLLRPGGRALVLQLSILGQVRTAELLASYGLEARVVDYSFFPFGELFEANAAPDRPRRGALGRTPPRGRWRQRNDCLSVGDHQGVRSSLDGLMPSNDAEVLLVRATLDDLPDLLDREPQLVVGVVVVRAEADARIGAEVAEDLPLGELLVHGRELRHVDGDGAAAPLGASRAPHLEAGLVGEVDQQLRLAQ